MARLAQRGEIWLVDLGMTAKERPAVVLSVAFLDSERALVTYVPRTTSLRGGRFEVAHQAPLFKPGAFDAQNIGTVPVVRLVKPLARLHDSVLKQVESAVSAWLGLPSCS
jgi:mRNA interferase MazF